MEAGEKGSVVKHLDGESDSCRTRAWDGRKNWSVRPGVAIGLQLQADIGAEICCCDCHDSNSNSSDESSRLLCWTL